MSSTCFTAECSSSGRRLYIQLWYSAFYMHQQCVFDTEVHSVGLYGIIILQCAVQKHKSYRGADKSLARPGREQVNVSVRMA